MRGSWPVSTDRVSWALGAEAVLATLDGDKRAVFADLALRALAGTLEADRAAAFDAADGLYRGEQSFLDWRTQTYAPYVADDLVKSLDLQVETRKGVVQLSGFVDSQAQIDQAVALTRAVAGVTDSEPSSDPPRRSGRPAAPTGP